METTEGVANFFIQQSIDDNCVDLSQLKLQKLVYYAHGWHLGLTNGVPLFAEPVQAWRYGPVIQSLRGEFRTHGSNIITTKARAVRWQNGQLNEQDYTLSGDERIPPFLMKIWNEYKKYTPIQLTNMTHEVGGPWYQIAAYYQFKIPEGTQIPNPLIRDYFQKLVRAA